MSKGDWAGKLALAIVIFLIACFALWVSWKLSAISTQYADQAKYYADGYEHGARDSIDRVCRGQAPPADIECIEKYVAAKRESQRGEYDLAAQEAMAEWALWMTAATVAGVLVGFAGFVAVVFTLREQQRATEAVIQSERPWIEIESVLANGPMEITEHGVTVNVNIKVKNAGRTPALRCNCGGHLVLSPWGQQVDQAWYADRMASIPLYRDLAKQRIGYAIFPGKDRPFPVRSGDHDPFREVLPDRVVAHLVVVAVYEYGGRSGRTTAVYRIGGPARENVLTLAQRTVEAAKVRIEKSDVADEAT